MTTAPALHWLPIDEDWRASLKGLRAAGDRSATAWNRAIALANARLDFTMTNALDSVVRELFGERPEWATRPLRLAILSSSTAAHLHAAIRIAALRRNMWVVTYENDYGQYLQELLDPASKLHAFAPDAVLFALDAGHLTDGLEPALGDSEAAALREAALERVRSCWALARDRIGCPVLQQTLLDPFPALLGNNEHHLAGSRSAAVRWLNDNLRAAASEAGVDIVALDQRQSIDGLAAWFSPALWHRSKQEVTPAAAPMYGDLVVRLLAARQGRSYKCLALDLDNTMWGGVIGDDGLDGIQIGQGSAAGEAFVALQTHARRLSQRGVILAVCSKNDEANALEPFDKHPDMVLRRADLASFVANWDDKAGNIRRIAAELNIGLDAIVFLDDNPFERNLVRQELPMVAVPELPDDPALFAACLSDAGYFESVGLTDEDRERTRQYQGNRERGALLAGSTDLDSYLRSLDMMLGWKRFDRLGLQRITQLINKTNQFNLTTRRYTEDEVRAVMDDPGAIGLQLRLSDRFGDNGIIAIVIGRLDEAKSLVIDSWLMSCRVLGRRVEQATLDLLVREAARMGAERLIGDYIPTKKNGMVAGHYQALGFDMLHSEEDGSIRAALALAKAPPPQDLIRIEEEE